MLVRSGSYRRVQNQTGSQMAFSTSKRLRAPGVNGRSGCCMRWQECQQHERLLRQLAGCRQLSRLLSGLRRVHGRSLTRTYCRFFSYLASLPRCRRLRPSPEIGTDVGRTDLRGLWTSDGDHHRTLANSPRSQARASSAEPCSRNPQADVYMGVRPNRLGPG